MLKHFEELMDELDRKEVFINAGAYREVVKKVLAKFDVFIVNEDGNSNPIKLFSYLETLIFGKEDK